MHVLLIEAVETQKIIFEILCHTFLDSEFV